MTVKPPTKSRQRKIECEGCGAILYGSAATIASGLPTCACGDPFIVANLGDLAVIDPDAFEAALELAQLGTTGAPNRGGEYNATMRVLGYHDATISPNSRGSRQCKDRGCKRLRVPLSDFCADHGQEVPF
jgi:hypothetical protein